jgi:hypothetical protein
VRQVGEAELVWNLKLALRGLSATQRNELLTREIGVRKRAEHSVAAKLAEQLKRYEILSEAPLPEGSELFSRAAFGTSDQPMIGSADE